MKEREKKMLNNNIGNLTTTTNTNSENLLKHKKYLNLANKQCKQQQQQQQQQTVATPPNGTERRRLPLVYTTFPNERMYSKLLINSLLSNQNSRLKTAVVSMSSTGGSGGEQLRSCSWTSANSYHKPPVQGASDASDKSSENFSLRNNNSNTEATPELQSRSSISFTRSSGAASGADNRINVYYSRNEINFRLAKALRNRRNVTVNVSFRIRH